MCLNGSRLYVVQYERCECPHDLSDSLETEEGHLVKIRLSKLIDVESFVLDLLSRSLEPIDEVGLRRSIAIGAVHGLVGATSVDKLPGALIFRHHGVSIDPKKKT